MRLKRRLALFFMLIIIVGAGSTLALVRMAAGGLLRSFVYSGDADKARIYASILGDYYADNGSWDGTQAFLRDLQGYQPESLADRIAVADSSGIIVADTSGRLQGTVHPAEHVLHGVPIPAGTGRSGTVLVGSMVDSSLSGLNERFVTSIMSALLWATSLSAVLAIALGFLFSARVTRPLAALNEAVKKVSSGDLAAAVEVAGSDEISELSASFNEMTGELKRLEEAKRRIIADSAHELRTPVTLIRGTIEAMMDGIYPLNAKTLESVHEETIRLSRLIDTLRELESMESGSLILALEDVDAAQIARKAIALFSSATDAKGLRVSFSAGVDGTPSLKADYYRLGEVVYNLMSNAIKYTPKGGAIAVRVDSCQRAGTPEVSISVDDSGPGIPTGERDKVFERFYRLDASRSTDLGGRGLGLAIAREIVKAHGGSIRVGESALGGASFVVTLPSARSPTAHALR